MNRLVVDACVAVKWFIREEDSEAAHALLTGSQKLVAPDFALVEIANALWKSHRRKIMDREQAQARLAGAPRFFDQLLPTSELLKEALELACAIDQAVYDCTYVVASRRMGVPLITSDTKLLARLARTPDAKNAIHLSDRTSPP
jgi:predicted nucleic acid-binding protein